MFPDQKFSSSILANSFSLKGSITCKGELQIEGRITGNINGEKVILGPDSSMDGILSAEEVVISGKFKGKIKGKSIRLHSSAIVDAEINYEILAIEDGSSVNGVVKKMVSSTPIKKQPSSDDKKKEEK